MKISIKRRIVISIVGISLIYMLSISALFWLAMSALKAKSDGYIESVSRRYVERVSLIIREKARALEGLGGHLRFEEGNKPYFGQGYKNVHYPPHHQAELVELFTQYQYGMEYESFMLLDEDRTPVMYFERGYLTSLRGGVPAEIIESIEGLHEGKYRVVARRGRNSFYVLHAPYPRTSESHFRNTHGVGKVLAIEFRYDVFRRIVDEIIYNEEEKNGIVWAASFIDSKGEVLWSNDDGWIENAGIMSVKASGDDSIGSNGEYYITALQVPRADWMMLLAVERDPVFSAVTRLYLLGISIIVVGAAVLVLFMRYMDKRIGRPLKRLTEATIKLGEGDYCVQLEDKSDDEIGVLGSSFMEMARKMQQYQKDIRDAAAMAAVGQVSSQVAHDVRSPISVMKSFLEYSTPKMNDDEEKLLLEAAKRSVGKLEGMAEELVDYLKATKLNRSKTSYNEIIRGAIEECRWMAHEKAVDLISEGGEEMSLLVDGQRMERVFVNLIRNAVRAIDHEKGEVRIETRCERGGRCSVQVQDNGRGISPENLLKIFENFYTTDSKKGTGLGLAYCKQVVEAHGGTIEVESEVGKGTTFRIVIPNAVVDADENPQEKEERVITRTTALTVPVDGKNYAVIDDDEDIREQWHRIIDEKGGRIVYSAATVSEVKGSKSIDAETIDTAIVDYHFEGDHETGIELIAYLKQRGIKRVHLCTGFHDDEEICRRARAAGAESVIPKPIHDDDVEGLFA